MIPELADRVEAFREAAEAKDKAEWFRTAWLASRIVSYQQGREISVSDLLPEMFPGKVWTKKKVKEGLTALKKELGIK